MATIIAPTLAVAQYSGDEGNASVAFGFHTLAAAAINDTVIVLRLYAGTKIYRARLVTAALGAGVTLDVGTKNEDGSAGGSLTSLFAAQAASTAGAFESASAPVIVAKDSLVVVTVKGGAATGKFDLVVEYEFRGV